MTIKRFFIYLVTLLLVPAVFYAVGVGNNKDLLWVLHDPYFLVNYLYWAFPHLFFSAIALVMRVTRKTLLLNLAMFNVMLVARRLWVVFIPTSGIGALEVLPYYALCFVGIFVTHLLRLVLEPGYEVQSMS